MNYVFYKILKTLFRMEGRRETLSESTCIISSNTAIVSTISLVACTQRLLARCPTHLDTFQQSRTQKEFLMNNELNFLPFSLFLNNLRNKSMFLTKRTKLQ
jgi:hypothetical protein